MGEFVKANKIKPGKWPIEEIIIDLNKLNEKDIVMHFGKQVKLKNLEDWNIIEHLSNFLN